MRADRQVHKQTSERIIEWPNTPRVDSTLMLSNVGQSGGRTGGRAKGDFDLILSEGKTALHSYGNSSRSPDSKDLSLFFFSFSFFLIFFYSLFPKPWAFLDPFIFVSTPTSTPPFSFLSPSAVNTDQHS